VSRTTRAPIFHGRCNPDWPWEAQFYATRRDGLRYALVQPSHTFKVLRKRRRRAKDRDALRHHRDPERWRKADRWDWL
jgi:hypothetical protein